MSRDNARRLIFAFCECRLSIPFRGRQINIHKKRYPDHHFGPKFRACLFDLKSLEGEDPAQKALFIKEHENCPAGNVNSCKSREFFASRTTSCYLKSRRLNVREESSEEEEALVEEEEEDGEMVEEGVALQDEETLHAVQSIVEPPPEGFGNMLPSTTQDEAFYDWGQEMDLINPTPRPHASPSAFPPSPSPPPARLALSLPPPNAEVAPPPAHPPPPPEASSTHAPPLPLSHPPPPVPTSSDPIIPLREWGQIQRIELTDRLSDSHANNKSLAEQLKTMAGQLASWKQRADSIKRQEQEALKREEEVAVREQSASNAEEILRLAQRELEEGRCQLEAKRNAFEEEADSVRAVLATEREELRRDKRTLHTKEAELREVAAKLRESKERVEAKRLKLLRPAITELHVPLANGAIAADPSKSGCVIAAGEGCGHLRLRPNEEGGIDVISYYSTLYSKQPATMALHEPPAKRPRM